MSDCGRLLQDIGAEVQRYACANGPLPIGHGQTISQLYIVALMTDLAELTNESRVLEVGSGYRTTILVEMVAEVDSIEIIPALTKIAGDGAIETRKALPAAFVPLTGEH